ncbi:hypothetical protein Tco_1120795 [Tanacetum coccineum]
MDMLAPSGEKVLILYQPYGNLYATTERGDGIACIKRRRHDLRSNGVSTLVTPSEQGRPNGTLEDSVS